MTGRRRQRKTARSRPNRRRSPIGASAPQEGGHALQLPGLGQAARHRPGLGDLSRRLLLEAYAPASVLINRKYECLYYLGATDGYLRAVSGEPSRDLLAMAREGLRNKLRAAIQRASEEGKRAVVSGGQIEVGGNTVSVSIAVQPVQNQGEEFLLVSFLGKPKSGQRSVRYAAPADAVEVARIEELEHELDVTRKELQRAIHDLQISSEEQMAIDEEAQSVNEEFLSTNEKLTTSKEELQSLNEELTALNSRLHETLERQRSTSDDLQNILYSSGVATLFLDRDLKIRFFTSAARSLFPVIASDIGRPLADLKSLSADTDLLADARLVLANLTPMKHEIEARDGAWYNCRILPYHTEDNRVEGVVITFADVSETKAAERKIHAARAYSNSIIDTVRQPLVVLDEELRVVSANRCFHDTFALEPAETVGQPLGDTGDDHFDIPGLRGFLDRVRAEPAPIEDREIEFDLPRLGRRALLLNARKIRDASSGKGKILLAIEDVTERKRAAEVVEAAKRHAERANIAKARFLEAASHDLRQSLQSISLLQGLMANNIKDEGALKLVARLDETLSVTAGMLNTLLDINELEAGIVRAEPQAEEGAHRTSAILVVEDEPAVREMLKLLLDGEGHRTACAADGRKALELVARRAIRPDLMVVDYNLPNGMSGLQVIAGLQKMLHDEIPAIILTGDISTEALREIVHQGCLRLNKPVKAKDLTHLVQQLLAKPRPAPDVYAPQQADTAGGAQPETIFVIDDDSSLRDAMRELLQAEGWRVESYASGEAFFEAYHSGVNSCLLVDAWMPGMSGLDVLQRLKTEGHRLAAIMITGGGDVPMAVQAMKAGAADFIEKPIGREELLASIERALELTRDSAKLSVRREAAASRLGSLTTRQRQVMDLVLAGHPNKNIAADLGVSQRTIETHRRAIMKKTGSKSLPALVRLALAAT